MQEVTPAEDITYDMNLPARETPSLLSSKKLFLQENIKRKIVEIFKKHGGLCLTTPLLMPKSGQHSSFTESSVKLMTRTGSVVSIPHDLRTPFARYIIWNNISHIRRYAIERVFRDKKVCLGFLTHISFKFNTYILIRNYNLFIHVGSESL